MKSVFALAVLAAIGFTGTAFAEDATKAWTTTAGPAAMSDSEMDKVTAGEAVHTVTPKCIANGSCDLAAKIKTINGNGPGDTNSHAASHFAP